MTGQRIASLMNRARDQYDLAWLQESLQAAIEVELSTIPPYLLAYWSIKNRGPADPDPVAVSIQEIVIEEMVHMGIVCNLLVAIGGAPDLTSVDAVPRYPGPLPGNINPDITVYLEGLSASSLATFQAIEFPQGGPIAFRVGQPVSTIGEFYSRLLEAFETLDPPLSGTRQQADDFSGLSKFTTLEEVRAGIELIKHQGEGSRESPEEQPNDLAHYYQFGEIARGKRFVKDPLTGLWDYNGDPLPFPDVWPVEKLPAGGYRPEDVPADVQARLAEFDAEYSALLRSLERAWAEGASTTALQDTIPTMNGLTALANGIVSLSRADGAGNYGPCFRFARH